LDTSKIPNNNKYRLDKRNKISLKLCVNDNINPVLYIDNKKFSINGETSFYEIKPSSGTWTKSVDVYFPNAVNPRDNIANYIKLYYYLGDPVASSNNRLLNEKYYSTPFCPIDLENLGNAAIKNRRVENPNPVYIKEKLQNDGTGNFSYSAASGAYWDTNRILFYCKSIIKNNSSGKQYINTFKKKLSLNNTKYSSELGNEFYIVCKKYQTVAGELKILGLNSYHQGKVLKEKEDLLLLGLTIAEIQTLKNVSGLSPNHPKFIYLEQDQHLCDIHKYRYYRYLVKIQGLNSSEVPTIVSPASPIIVYSRDNMFFHSPGFAVNESYCMVHDNDNNRIEFSIFGDNGHIYINDNIDFSLIRKSKVTDFKKLNSTYSIEDEDEPNNIPNGPSKVQKIYYLYYKNMPNVITASTSHTEICQLDIIMENKLKRNGPSAGTLEANASNDAAFSQLGYTKKTDYAGLTGIDAQYSYRNIDINSENFENIITRGKVTRNKVTVIENHKYENLKAKVFMVLIAGDQINNCQRTANKFEWVGTVRYFARPDLFAVFLGALIDISLGFLNNTVLRLKCGGFAFSDSSSFPSYNHVNGDALDISYFIPPNKDNNFDFISAIHKYGVGKFLMGPSYNSIVTAATNAGINAVKRDDHDDHLHTEDIKIKFR